MSCEDLSDDENRSSPAASIEYFSINYWLGLRLEQATPLLDTIKQQIEAARADALPSSALGKPASYTLALWPKLTCFLEASGTGVKH